MAKRNSIEPIPPFPSDIDRRHFGSWISGFVDGEGTFVLNLQGQKGSRRQTPRACLQIKLRADDTPTLELIRSFFGCGLIISDCTPRPGHPAWNPQAAFVVVKAADLVKIILPHFRDHCPLQAKKRRDLPLWERGVYLIWAVRNRRNFSIRGPGRQGRSPKWRETEIAEFRALCDALRVQRAYDSGPVPLPPPSPKPPAPRTFFDGLPFDGPP